MKNVATCAICKEQREIYGWKESDLKLQHCIPCHWVQSFQDGDTANIQFFLESEADFLDKTLVREVYDRMKKVNYILPAILPTPKNQNRGSINPYNGPSGENQGLGEWVRSSSHHAELVKKLRVTPVG